MHLVQTSFVVCFCLEGPLLVENGQQLFHCAQYQWNVFHWVGLAPGDAFLFHDDQSSFQPRCLGGSLLTRIDLTAVQVSKNGMNFNDGGFAELGWARN